MKEQYVIQFGNGSYFKASRKTKCVTTMEEATKFDSLEAVQKIYLRYGHLMTAFGARTLNVIDPIDNLFNPIPIGIGNYVIVLSDGRYLGKIQMGRIFRTQETTLTMRFKTREEALEYVKANKSLLYGTSHIECLDEKESEVKTMEDKLVLKYRDNVYLKYNGGQTECLSEARTFYNRESIYKYINENNEKFMGIRWTISVIEDELKRKEPG